MMIFAVAEEGRKGEPMKIINADKLIEKLSTNLDNPEEFPVISLGTVMRMIADEPEVQLEQKWIPASERLPDLDEDGYSQKVLACYENISGCDILEYRAIDGIGKWYIGDMDESPEDIGAIVSAWMPLPEPYKGEQHERYDQ